MGNGEKVMLCFIDIDHKVIFMVHIVKEIQLEYVYLKKEYLYIVYTT